MQVPPLEILFSVMSEGVTVDMHALVLALLGLVLVNAHALVMVNMLSLVLVDMLALVLMNMLRTYACTCACEYL